MDDRRDFAPRGPHHYDSGNGEDWRRSNNRRISFKRAATGRMDERPFGRQGDSKGDERRGDGREGSNPRHGHGRRSISKSSSQPRRHLYEIESPMSKADETAEHLMAEKLEYLLSLDDRYDEGKGTIGLPDPHTGYAPKPHPQMEDMILPIQIGNKLKAVFIGDAVPDQPLGVYTDVKDWLTAWDVKATFKGVYHEDINAQLMRGSTVVCTPDMKALIMSHWMREREDNGDIARYGQHLIRTASI